jgi:hypothetical protein
MVSRGVPVTELVAQADSNGYKRGVHRERDMIHGREKHIAKTKRDQDATRTLYFVRDLLLLSRSDLMLTFLRWYLAGMPFLNEHIPCVTE